MAKLAFGGWLIAYIVLLLIGTAAQARTLFVDCGGKEGLTSIRAAVKLLESSEAAPPNTINVSGDCKENVLIQNLDRLTLQAVKGATITDASGGVDEVIDVKNSSGFTLSGFSLRSTCPSGCLNGPGADVVDCYYGSECLFIDDTFAGAGNGAGVGVYPLAKAIVQGGKTQDNLFGLFTNDSGQLFVVGVVVKNNTYGIYMNHGGNVAVRVGADGATPTVIEGNTQQGILSNLGGTVSIHAPAKVANNGAEGIYLALGSKLFIGGGTGAAEGIVITGNGGSGVSINDLSIAEFGGNAHVAGNASPNVACNAPTALTVGAIAATGGTPGLPYTNCSK